MGNKVVAYLSRDKDLLPYAALFNTILGKQRETSGSKRPSEVEPTQSSLAKAMEALELADNATQESRRASSNDNGQRHRSGSDSESDEDGNRYHNTFDGVTGLVDDLDKSSAQPTLFIEVF